MARTATSKPKVEQKAPPLLVTVVLDRSGSMDACKAEAIEAFNSYLMGLRDDQAKQGSVALMTLRQFDTEHDLLFRAIPVDKAPFLDDTIYQPRGSTALNDAIAYALVDLDGATVPAETIHLLVVLTDGFENASKEHTTESIKKLLEEREAKGDLTVTFLQGSLDTDLAGAQATAAAYGISPGNVGKFSAGVTGSTSASVGSLSRSTSRLRQNSASGQSVSAALFADAGEVQDFEAPVWNEKTQQWEAKGKDAS